jgi:hypothetical protein
MFGKYVDLRVFVVSFILGVVALHFAGADKVPIVVHPTPDNQAHLVYKDSAGTCYKYIDRRLPCPRDGAPIKEIPPQY